MWADSHCHIDYEGVGPDAIEAAHAAGVARMVTIGTDARTSAMSVETARGHEGVWATVGLHPHEASEGVDTIRSLLEPPDPVVVGVGECGLDYFYEHSDRPSQREAFAEQIRLAKQLDLALVIHTRDAWDETFEILDDIGVPERWVVHCFSGGPHEAELALARGAYLSFSGIVTFKNAEDVRSAAIACPLERMLVETDSPFLAPVPNRGKKNQPGWVPLVGAAVAELKGIEAATVAQATWDNTSALFRLDPV